MTVEAIDISGKISKLNFIPRNGNTCELDINELSGGVYNLRVVTENAAVVSKFVKQ